MNLDQQTALKAIKTLASNDLDVEVLWLYGSRARQTAQKDSDYDLAVAFKNYVNDPVERRLRPELLAIQWQNKLGIKISIIDISQASLPMAYTVVQDNELVYCNNHYRLMVEEQRIMSKWEIDYSYHRKQYA